MTLPGFTGRVAVVTGGSRGIGAAACRLLVADGARVAAVGLDPDEVQDVVDELRWMGGEAIGVVADCTDPQAVRALRERITGELGEPSLLFAFAIADREREAGREGERPRDGGDDGAHRAVRLLDLDLAAWQRAVDAELTSTFLTVQAFLPAMLAARNGTIVTVGASGSSGTDAASVAAGGGIAAFTRHVAGEVAAAGVRVNCLTCDSPPGPDAAYAALYLASDLASRVHAATLAIAGGNFHP